MHVNETETDCTGKQYVTDKFDARIIYDRDYDTPECHNP
jgi:hypothetical protein